MFLSDPDSMFIGIIILILTIVTFYYLVLFIIALKFLRERKQLQNNDLMKHIVLLFFSVTPILLISLWIAQAYF